MSEIDTYKKLERYDYLFDKLDFSNIKPVWICVTQDLRLKFKKEAENYMHIKGHEIPKHQWIRDKVGNF